MLKNTSDRGIIQANAPAHDLEEVQRLAATGGRYFNPSENKAIELVAEALELTPDAARVYIQKLIARLTPNDYAHTLTEKTPPADVYGLSDGLRGWYVKVAIRRGQLQVISCHLPGEPLRTRCGTITRQG